MFKRAFTLLELLVVIGIIVVLLGVLNVSYSTAQKKTRDAVRLENLNYIRQGLEQYYTECDFVYPFDGTQDPFDLSGDLTCKGKKIFTYPLDPLGGYKYQCVSDKSGNKCSTSFYTICPSVNVNGGKRLETKDCSDSSDKSCCVQSQQ